MILDQRIFFNRFAVFCLAFVLLFVIGVVKKLKKKSLTQFVDQMPKAEEKKKCSREFFMDFSYVVDNFVHTTFDRLQLKDLDNPCLTRKNAAFLSY